MELKKIKISANGKLIISGEHAVLYNYPCISIAINKKLTVEIIQRNDKQINVNSTKFRKETFTLNTKTDVKPWCRAIYFLCHKLSKVGLDIFISSKIPAGCGSSGALFSCISCGLLLIKNNNLTKRQLLNKTLKLYFDFHKDGIFKPSGIDIITSIFGGLIYYEPKKKIIKHLPIKFFKDINIYAIYTGFKTKTEDTINIACGSKNSKQIYSKIGEITKNIVDAIYKNNYSKFLFLIEQNQQCLNDLRLSGENENNILQQCKRQNVVAKISGSGLGDYMIAFSKNNLKISNYETMNIKINHSGIFSKIEKWFFAPINIALIKYWGKRNEKLNLPMSSSISITSNHLGTMTKIERSKNNIVIFNKKKVQQNCDFYSKMFSFVDYFKRQCNIQNTQALKITTSNNIPTASGLASSASGFAGLTFALNSFFVTNLAEKQLSQIARIGSGSATRSVIQNAKFVIFHRGMQDNGSDCFAERFNVGNKDFRMQIDMFIIILSRKKKQTSSRTAMQLTVENSLVYKQWLEQTQKDLVEFGKIKNFNKFGKMVENNSLLMHKAINEVGVDFFNKKTYKMIDFILKMRKDKINIYFTIDAGANVAVFFKKKDKEYIKNKILQSKIVKQKDILEF